MVGARKNEAGFTLTEVMVVVVILSLLAAISTPLFTRDNKARKGRDWSKMVAQILQRARFQAMGDRAPIHVKLYRTHVDVYREAPPVPPAVNRFTLLNSIPGPTSKGDETVAIWAARKGNIASPASRTDDPLVNGDGRVDPVENVDPADNEIVFLPLGSTWNNQNWRIYIRNELLPPAHPDATFVINVRGLTGFVSSNDKWTLP